MVKLQKDEAAKKIREGFTQMVEAIEAAQSFSGEELLGITKNTDLSVTPNDAAKKAHEKSIWFPEAEAVTAQKIEIEKRHQVELQECLESLTEGEVQLLVKAVTGQPSINSDRLYERRGIFI